MKKQTVIDPLDDPKAALRTLFVLSGQREGMNVMAMYMVMSERFGVGRPATDSSCVELVGAGLVEVNEVRRDGRRFKVVKLTDKGLRVAVKFREIVGILQGDNERS